MTSLAEEVHALEEDGTYADAEYVETIGSTNAELLHSGKPHMSVLVAGEQTAGRGRMGRAWVAPEGAQLTFSVAVETSDLDRLGTLTLAAGLAITDAITGTTLKWPNDVLLNNKKLCGILAEGAPIANSNAFRIVIGVGVNNTLTRDQLPVEHATSLALEGRDMSLAKLADKVLRAMRHRLDQWISADQQLIDDYRRVCATIGADVRVETPTGNVFGQVDGVADDGRIIVDGEAFSAGDVHHLRPAGY